MDIKAARDAQFEREVFACAYFEKNWKHWSRMKGTPLSPLTFLSSPNICFLYWVDTG